MQRVNEFQFYELAIAIHPLTEAKGDAKYSGVWLDWSMAGDKLSAIFGQRSLEFCLDAANDLYRALGWVVPHDFQEAIKKLQELPQPESEKRFFVVGDGVSLWRDCFA
jgi:hypothetical protein